VSSAYQGAIVQSLMKKLSRAPSTQLAAALGLATLLGLASIAPAVDLAAKPYKILATTQIPAAGGIDYVTADSVNRRVYVACGNVVSVFDLDTYKLAGSLANASGHGVSIDPENHTGLVSGNPAVFFNTQTLEQIKTIPAPGADGYVFDALTHHFVILSHRAPIFSWLTPKTVRSSARWTPLARTAAMPPSSKAQRTARAISILTWPTSITSPWWMPKPSK